MRFEAPSFQCLNPVDVRELVRAGVPQKLVPLSFEGEPWYRVSGPLVESIRYGQAVWSGRFERSLYGQPRQLRS
jgi:hypothetical protein